jgi:hypothetical protein
MVRNRSWPAVSQICSLTRLPSSSMVLILKSMPMVVMKDGVKESSLNRSRQHDFPTPESPISRSLICGGQARLAFSHLTVEFVTSPNKGPLLARVYLEGVCERGGEEKSWEHDSYQEIVIAIARGRHFEQVV